MATIQPERIYKIIGASNPNSSIIGRLCKTIFKFTDRPAHSLWGNIWRVESVDGATFVDGFGDDGYAVNVAEDWLEEYTEPPKELVSEEAGLRKFEIDMSHAPGRGLLKTYFHID